MVLWRRGPERRPHRPHCEARTARRREGDEAHRRDAGWSSRRDSSTSRGSRATCSCAATAATSSKLTQGVTTEILGEAYTVAPVSDAHARRSSASDHGDAQRSRAFQGPHGFDAWLRAMEAHGDLAQRRLVRGCEHDARVRNGAAHGCGAPGAQLDSMRAAMRDAHGGRRVRPRQRAHLSAGQLREHRRADRNREGDGAVRRRVHHAHALRGRSGISRRSTRRFASGRKDGVPVEIYHLKAAGKRNWGKAARRCREDRLGARGRTGCAGEHVSVHGGRHRARCVPAAVGVGGRKALREPRRLREAREDPRGHRAPDERTGRVSASSRRRRACCSRPSRNPTTRSGRDKRLVGGDGGDGQGLAGRRDGSAAHRASATSGRSTS